LLTLKGELFLDLRTIYKHVVEGTRKEIDTTLDVFDNLSKTISSPLEEHPEVDLCAGDFITSETCLIFSGPPLQDMALKNPDLVKLVGLCINFSLNLNKRHSPWEELGVKDGGMVPGRPEYTIEISRLVSAHNNILYTFYKWLTALMLAKKNKGGSKEPIFATVTSEDKLLQTQISAAASKVFIFEENPGFFTLQSSPAGSANDAGLYNKNRSTDQYVGLGSEFFNAPFGIFVSELDGFGNVSANYYCENCKFLTYGKSYGESPTIIESIGVRSKRVLPGNSKLALKLKPSVVYTGVGEGSLQTPSVLTNNTTPPQVASVNPS
jgi:hypothetical protein